MARPRSSSDFVSVVEAAYDIEKSDTDWLKELVVAVAPFVDHGFGVWAFMFDTNRFRRGELVYEHPTAVGLPPDWLEGLRATLAITTRDTHAMFELMFAMPCHTMSTILRRKPKMLSAVRSAIAIPGVQDAIGLTARDTSGNAVFIGAHSPRVFELDHGQAARFGRISAHIATANRLRRTVRKSRSSTTSSIREELEARAEAVLSPRGKVAHATKTAASNPALETLKRAATAVDDAVGQLRHRDPDEALRIWEGLVRGRWSLVASFDDNGRRVFLAEPNEPVVPTLNEPLSKREKLVAGYLLAGHADKLIGYELGLSEGTVSSVVSRLRRKLDAKTPAALMRILSALARKGDLER